MRAASICIIILLLSKIVLGQHVEPPKKVYEVNLKWELPVSTLLLGASYFGFRALDKNASYTVEDVQNLDVNKINAFDRPVAFYNPNNFEKFHNTSDVLLNIAVISPVILGLDKTIRKDWLDLTTLFIMTHTINNAIYFTSSLTIRRARPLTYNHSYDIGKRIGEAKSNSFYSGHVSTSAASTFFAAKVFTDYHGIKGWKRMLIYTGAAIPPAMVGYYRMMAGKHFRTDVMVGLIIGSATGILVPEFHRIKSNSSILSKVSMQPFYMNGYTGTTFSLSL